MYNTISAPELLDRIRALEKEVAWAVGEQELRLGYRLVAGKVRFEEDRARLHALLRTRLVAYIAGARPLAILTAPLIYACLIPMLLLDAAIGIYQAVCFPVYGIPKTRRGDYILFDRGKLRYLNLIERINCAYCSYANGLFAWCVEVAARTEQHWCPVKHSQRLRAPHSRYGRFADYGDAAQYRERLEELRRDFADLAQHPPAGAKPSRVVAPDAGARVKFDRL
jgi:hypothetical protein